MDTSKIIENQVKIDQPCAAVLGSTQKVKSLANFWEKNADLVQMIQANGLLEYCQSESFNSDELVAFRKGLLVFGEFAENACVEASSQSSE